MANPIPEFVVQNRLVVGECFFVWLRMYGQTNRKRYAAVVNDNMFMDCTTRTKFTYLHQWATICCVRELYGEDLNVLKWEGKLRARLEHIGGVGRHVILGPPGSTIRGAITGLGICDDATRFIVRSMHQWCAIHQIAFGRNFSLATLRDESEPWTQTEVVPLHVARATPAAKVPEWSARKWFAMGLLFPGDHVCGYKHLSQMRHGEPTGVRRNIVSENTRTFKSEATLQEFVHEKFVRTFPDFIPPKSENIYVKQYDEDVAHFIRRGTLRQLIEWRISDLRTYTVENGMPANISCAVLHRLGVLKVAERFGFVSTNGTPLSDDYEILDAVAKDWNERTQPLETYIVKHLRDHHYPADTCTSIVYLQVFDGRNRLRGNLNDLFIQQLALLKQLASQANP